jgi:hypothetical protein
VHEITIAGNLREMYAAIEAVGNDIDPRSHMRDRFDAGRPHDGGRHRLKRGRARGRRHRADGRPVAPRNGGGTGRHLRRAALCFVNRALAQNRGTLDGYQRSHRTSSRAFRCAVFR